MNVSVNPVLKTATGSFPALGFGTWQLKNGVARAAVRAALETGYRHIDTARLYKNEEAVGQGVADSNVARGEIFLTTKIAQEDLDESSVKREMDASLKALNTDYVDLLLVHWPSKSVPLAETLGAMSELRTAGKTRHVGVSNFTLRWLQEALDVSPCSILCNQVEYHPYLSQQRLWAFCRANDVALTAYCPLAKGRIPDDPALQEIGRTHGKSAVQVAIRWFLQQEGVGLLPRSSKPERIRSNFNVFDFELSDQEMERIFSLDCGERIINPSWAPEWD